MLLSIVVIVGALGVLFAPLFIAFLLRKVVPTNMVHIVQSSKKTTPYGRGKECGNVYYRFPSWIPVVGVEVTEFPESIFEVSLKDYEAYDEARLPFIVDITAFFRVDQAEKAAQRIENFTELHAQLKAVLQGAVRRILATNNLELIMEDRSKLGSEFTKEVGEQITNWGVVTVKTIEFMDIRDSRNGNVIEEIMEKEKSRINMESRQKVAQNNREAELTEIEARRTVEVEQQDAEQQVGIRTAEKEKTVGIAKEMAQQDIAEQGKVTAEKVVAVLRVNEQERADIARNVLIVDAEGKKQSNIVNAEGLKQSTILQAEAQLEQTLKEAVGIKEMGISKAKAEELMLQAPVDAQIKLAKEIGENQGYQEYLVRIEQVNATKEVGIEMSAALAEADLKIISTGDGNIQGGAARLMDTFTPAGGTKLSGMLTALAATEAGEALLGKFGVKLDPPTE